MTIALDYPRSAPSPRAVLHPSVPNPPTPRWPAMQDPTYQRASVLNQQTYEQLKMALGLNLRRQLFIGVCDNLNLRNQIAVQLHAELGQGQHQGNHYRPGGQLVSLMLDLNDPNPVGQVARWLRPQLPPQGSDGMTLPGILGFQMLGIEHLTQQPAAVQRLFLSYLRSIDRSLVHFNFSLLLWVNRPWGYMIRQFAPECWNWCTGIFEFMGDPVPMLSPLFEAPPQAVQVTATPLTPPPRPASAAPGVPPRSPQIPLSTPHPAPPANATPLTTTHPNTYGDLLEIFSQDMADLPAEVAIAEAYAQEISSQSSQSPPSPPGQPFPASQPAPQQPQPYPPQSRQQPFQQPQAWQPTPQVPPTAPQSPQSPQFWQAAPLPPAPAAPPAPKAPPQPPAQTPPSAPPFWFDPEQLNQLVPINSLEALNAHLQANQNHPTETKFANSAQNGSKSSQSPSPQSSSPISPNLPKGHKAYGEEPIGPDPIGHPDAVPFLNLQDLASLGDPPPAVQQPTAKAQQPTAPGAGPAAPKVSQNGQKQAPVPQAVSSAAEDEDAGEVTLPPPPPPNSVAGIEARIAHLRKVQAPIKALAGAYLDLGRYYRTRIEQGSSEAEVLKGAVMAYEQVLEWLCFSEISPEELGNVAWCDILNDLGTLYWMAARSAPSREDGQEYLKQAVQSYNLGLKKTDEAEQPRSYAMLQNNLGTVYSDMAQQGNTLENLRNAIVAYEAALRHRRADTDPLKFAATQNNLGTAYWHLAQYEDPVHNLQQAIEAYDHALRYYQPQQEPSSYAMIQNNLGTAYWNLAQQTQKSNQPILGSENLSCKDWLLLAVDAYRSALHYRTLETAPAGYAATQNNLGTAYWHLANLCDDADPNHGQYMKLSIQAYEAALEAADQVTYRDKASILSFDRSATHNNLGMVYYHVALWASRSKGSETATGTGNAVEENLLTALHHQVQAVQGWQFQPEFYAAAIAQVVQTVRTCYDQGGTSGQNKALGQVPGDLLSVVMAKI
ncbi:MAG: tetratricopeptide repeat protein [Prochlorothrix sp.]|nr:tetratricopeptide repeat protein [Prochlorothrix sp.]